MHASLRFYSVFLHFPNNPDYPKWSHYAPTKQNPRTPHQPMQHESLPRPHFRQHHPRPSIFFCFWRVLPSSHPDTPHPSPLHSSTYTPIHTHTYPHIPTRTPFSFNLLAIFSPCLLRHSLPRIGKSQKCQNPSWLWAPYPLPPSSVCTATPLPCY